MLLERLWEPQPERLLWPALPATAANRRELVQPGPWTNNPHAHLVLRGAGTPRFSFFRVPDLNLRAELKPVIASN